jgi:hypothetical protein
MLPGEFRDALLGWVRRHKRQPLWAFGIMPVQLRRGAFQFRFGYAGVPPYWGARWDGMFHCADVGYCNAGEFYVYPTVVTKRAGYVVDPAGEYRGRHADLFFGRNLITLLSALKLAGHSHYGRPGFDVSPPGLTRRLHVSPGGVWTTGDQVHSPCGRS